ncbi:alcohol dehydrogenase catalytic domain-containing protein [Corynebacterium ammoniagenes]|uniref:alcohol dehydrogenase catalytic domain-containing protein n=1 Tax=Corynebacterium ammoniagenes TaxID=1697 RepID=UPI001459C87D|nr:alcohol dehydrogenase catalytic domain-containing protein [Corynebacterium ammoniagenes]NMF31825.1 alcohol dehydrogenase catalytic domain-containing protein [Corynebacterium ammoniagenes]
METTAPTEPICALVWTRAQNFEFVALAEPELHDGESLIRLNAATICGSDLHTISGRRSQPCPSVLGHEGAGVVMETKNPDLEIGQRVTFSVTAPCLECDRCQQGRTAKCRSVLKTGHEAFNSQWPLSGTYATHILLRKNQPVAVLSDAIADTTASVASCAGATVMAAVEAGGGLRGQRVLVVGLGMLGLIACDVAIQRGASAVYASDPNPERRQWASALGGVQAFDPAEEEVDSGSIDIAFDFSGVNAGVNAAISSLDIGGQAVLAGSVATSAAINVNPETLVRNWQTITGVHNYEPRHLQEAVDFLAHSGIDWNAVISAPIALEEVPATVEELINGDKDKDCKRYLRTAVVLSDGAAIDKDLLRH